MSDYNPKEKIECECGRLVSRRNMSKHKKSDIHFRYLKKKEEKKEETKEETKGGCIEENKVVDCNEEKNEEDTYFKKDNEKKVKECNKRTKKYDTKKDGIRYTTKVSKEGYYQGKRYVNPTLYVIELDTGKEREETKIEKQRRLHCERMKRSRVNKKNKE